MSPKFDACEFVKTDLPHFQTVLAGGYIMKEAAASNPTDPEDNFDRLNPVVDYECVSKMPEVAAVVTVAPAQDITPV